MRKFTTFYCCAFLLLSALCQAQTLSRIQYKSVKTLSAEEESEPEVQYFRQEAGVIAGIPLTEQLLKLQPGRDYESPISTRGRIISDLAFNRLLKQDMAFTVLGSQIPTPGFSLDLSDKLAVKVTGLVPQNNNVDRKIVTVDAEFARVGEDIPLLTDGKFTGKISGGINAHFLIPQLTGQYPHWVSGEPIVKTLRDLEKNRFEGPVLDTVAVLVAYLAITQGELLDHTCQSDRALLYVVGRAIPGYNVMMAGELIDEIDDNDRRKSLFIKMASKYYTLVKSHTDLVALVTDLRNLPSTASWRADALIKDLKRIAASYTNRQESVLDAEITYAKPYFLHKRLVWLSLSLRPVVYTYDAFEIDSVNSKSVSSKMNFLEFEVPLWGSFIVFTKTVETCGGWAFSLCMAPTGPTT